MQFPGKLAGRIAAVGVVMGAVLIPVAAAQAVTPPALTATPSTGLTNGQSVAVAGTGFAASTAYTLYECSALTGVASCDSTNKKTGMTGADGNITDTYSVKTGTIGSGTCPPATATDPCYLVATTDTTEITDATKTASASITFAAATTGPTLTVTPSTDVSAGDVLAVSGAGFKPSSMFAISECSGMTAASNCDTTVSDLVFGQTGADGTITASYTVKTGTIGDGTCNAGDTCYLAATTNLATTGGDATNTAFASFTIKADTGPTGPTITVTPSTDVADGQTVSVSGTGFPAAKNALYIVECSTLTGDPTSNCDIADGSLGSEKTNADGTFTASLKVVEGTFGSASCNAGDTCYIAASTSTDPSATDQSATTTFTFAKGGGSSGPAKTKTAAGFSKKKDTVFGVVTSGGAGVKGVKIKLELKKGSHYKTVDSTKTHKGGAFTFKHVKKSGKYKVKASKSSKYKGSSSKVFKVKV